MYTCRFALIVSIVIGVCATAHADPIINPRPGIVDIQDGDKPALQAIFSQLLGSDSALSALNNQTNYGSFQPTAQTAFTFLGSVAGYERSNVFGIYEANDTSISRVIFDRTDGPGATRHQLGDMVTGGFSPSAILHQFGFYLDVYAADNDTGDLDYTVYTDDSRNPGRMPQILVFFGNDQEFDPKLNIGLDGIFNKYDIILAIEDLNRYKGVSDDDFNDLVVLIENVAFGQIAPPPSFQITLPEPASMTVWGLLAAVGGFFSWRRRKPVTVAAESPGV